MDGEPVLKKLKKIKKCATGVDRISSLPDDVIVHILSFLSLKEAAASTSLLSRRWLHLWKHSPKLVFNFRYHANRNINRVNSVLKSLHMDKAPSLQEFRIKFHVARQDQHHVASWLEYAFSRQVERLDLNLRGVGSGFDKFCALLDQEMLKEIVGSSRISSFKSLKVLCFRSCELSGHFVGFFLRNCVSLERLVIYRAIRRSDFEVVGPSLKHLDMRSRSLEIKPFVLITYTKDKFCKESYSIKVRAPNLTWLTIDQNSNILFLEHVPKLVHLNFYCRFQLGDTMDHFANVAAQLQTLIIHLFDPKPKDAEFRVPKMPNLKKLVVYLRANYYYVPLPVTHFLCASPCLEEFKLDISELLVQVGHIAFGIGPPCPHRHLKLFVLSGFCGVTPSRNTDFGHLASILDLVRYIVDNCVGLEELVVGQCDRIGLVRDIMDSYDSLEGVIFQPALYRRRAHTRRQMEDFRNMIQLQQIPAHVKLRFVFEDFEPGCPKCMMLDN